MRGLNWSGQDQELTSVLFPEIERSALVGPACDVTHGEVSQAYGHSQSWGDSWRASEAMREQSW